jgi:hypothetical protein
MLSPQEKKYLKTIVEKELAHFAKEKKTLLNPPVSFLKGEHDYTHFLEGIIKKLS